MFNTTTPRANVQYKRQENLLVGASWKPFWAIFRSEHVDLLLAINFQMEVDIFCFISIKICVHGISPRDSGLSEWFHSYKLCTHVYLGAWKCSLWQQSTRWGTNVLLKAPMHTWCHQCATGVTNVYLASLRHTWWHQCIHGDTNAYLVSLGIHI